MVSGPLYHIVSLFALFIVLYMIIIYKSFGAEQTVQWKFGIIFQLEINLAPELPELTNKSELL